MDDVVASHIRRVLTARNGKVYGPSGAAEKLGVNPSTLRKRMDQLNIACGRKKQNQMSDISK